MRQYVNYVDFLKESGNMYGDIMDKYNILNNNISNVSMANLPDLGTSYITEDMPNHK